MYVVHIYIRKTLAFSRSKKTYPRGAIEPRFDRVSNFFSRFALDYYSRRFLILNERRMKDVVKKVVCWLQVTGRLRSRSRFPQPGWRTAWPGRAAWDGCSPADATRRVTRVSRLPRPGARNGSGAGARTISTTAWSSRDSS